MNDFELDRAAMRAYGYRVVDLLAEHFEKLLAAYPDNAPAKKGLAEAREKMREARLDEGP